MASDLNSVALVGRLTRDAELKYTNSGLQICRLSIANNYRRKQNEQWIEETNFFDCFMMGRRAEAIHKYLTKGTQIAIDGSLRFSKWESDGQTRSKVEVMINDIQLFGGTRGGYGDGGSGGGDRHESDRGSNDTPASDFEDDVPF
jgi:single-strand DNA-binding protein